MTDAPTLIARYHWRQVDNSPWDELSSDVDEVCVDRLTGREVVRYDLGDPANYQASHGGWSKREWLERKGCDPDAEIEVADAKVAIQPGEAERHASAKARKAQREAEEAAARELLSFLGDDANGFDFDNYSEGESAILRPALEKRGYSSIGFYMVEEDSFGPLIRGARATAPTGESVRFFYG